jgi:hypothetical protein
LLQLILVIIIIIIGFITFSIWEVQWECLASSAKEIHPSQRTAEG